MKKKMIAMVLAAVLAAGPAQGVYAENADAAASTTVTEVQQKVQPGWVKVKKSYRWRQEDGSYLNTPGWVTLEGKTYYLKKDGTRYTGFLTLNGKKYYLNPSLTYGFRRVNGKRYYFDWATGAARTGWQTVKKKTRYFLKAGNMASSRWINLKGKYYFIKKDGTCVPPSTWLKVKGKQYYISQKGYRVTGSKKIKGKRYFFRKDGSLITNQSSYKVKGQYYEIGENGVAVKVSAMKAQCYKKARAFVAKHTSSNMSNSQKFRTCFNYLMAYTNFKPWINPTDAEFKTTSWPYKYASYMFDNGLSGSCYGVASAVAACAKVLGYEPYVIATTGDHGFVMIDGLYYDNMGPLFGASTHFAYTTRSKVKF